MESFIQVVALYCWDLTKTILIYQEPLLTPKCQEIKIVWRENVIRKPFKTIRKRTLVRNIYFISVLGHLKWKFVDTCCSLAPFSIHSQRKTLSYLVSGLNLFWNIVLELIMRSSKFQSRQDLQLYWKMTPLQAFSCKFYWIFLLSSSLKVVLVNAVFELSIFTL